VVPLTPQEWEEKWWETYRTLRRANPTKSLQLVQKSATKWMLETYGSKPDPALPKPGLIQVIKMGLVVKRGISMFKFTPVMISAALVAGASAFAAAYNLAVGDGVITTMEWISVVWAVASAVTGTLFQSTPKPPVV